MKYAKEQIWIQFLPQGKMQQKRILMGKKTAEMNIDVDCIEYKQTIHI